MRQNPRNFKTSESKVSALFSELRDLWRSRREEINQKWKRTLPFADYIVDRWEKAHLLGFGEGSSIYDSSEVIGDVRVGENSWIGPFTLLDGSAGLTIGSYCSISAGVQIYTHETVEWAISGGDKEYRKMPTTIGSRCYIGPNTIIGMGVDIGDGCIIGAQSFVNENIPSGSKAYGNPCRVVGKVEW